MARCAMAAMLKILAALPLATLHHISPTKKQGHIDTPLTRPMIGQSSQVNHSHWSRILDLQALDQTDRHLRKSSQTPSRRLAKIKKFLVLIG